jgi:hypothetical protein
MGCDIHAVLVTEKNGKLEIVKDDAIPDRSYVLFGALAGIRSNLIEPLPQVRGRGLTKEMIELFPYTVDERSSLDKGAYIGDHSFTYLTLSELVDLNAKILDEMPNAIICCCPCHKDDEDVIDNTEEREYTKHVLDVLGSIYFDMLDFQGESNQVYLIMGFDS